MINTIYIEPKTEKEYTLLPNPWKGKISPLTPTNCTKFGWTIKQVEVADPVRVYTYSKLKLLTGCKNANIWDDVKSKIEAAGYIDEFNYAQNLSSSNDMFNAVVSQAKELYGDETVETILKGALVNEYSNL